MKRGDLIRVSWVDITDYPTAPPEVTKPMMFRSIGHYLGWVNDKVRGRFLRMSDTECMDKDDGDDESHYGAMVFPKGCIRQIDVLATAAPPEEEEETDEE